MTKLVIVESPAKAKTINKYLGKDYTVIASFGHVRDLSAKDGSVLPDKDFAMTWHVDAKGEKHLRDIISALSRADEVYLASDPDREGEAIAWHIVQELNRRKKLNVPVKRVVFNEITKNAVTTAIEHPRQIDMNLVDAYLARRALDYLVGFTLSPVLWRKLPNSKSAGRVQSVALRLVCERENEIESFKSQEYWTIGADMETTASHESFKAFLSQIDGKKPDKFAYGNAAAAEVIKAQVEAASYRVGAVEKKQIKRNPAPAFTTSTLQQEASRKLGFSAKKTMKVAQELYEGADVGGETVGLITYMRTDGVALAAEAVEKMRAYIEKAYGTDYMPDKPRFYKNTVKNAQEAHEAIRPTDINRTPEQMAKYLDKDHLHLYELVWKRALACQMASAVLDKVAVDIPSSDHHITLRATGQTIAFAGFIKVYKEDVDDADEEDSAILPPMKVGDELSLQDVLTEQHFTEPPPRYSEASLVKKMEELGIGRPSTYASILSVLQDREYVRLEKKRFIPEDRGRIVTAFLENFFNRYVQYDFTANLENQLDDITSGTMAWKVVLADFWKTFYQTIKDVEPYRSTDVLDKLSQTLENHLFPNDESRICPECGKGKLALKIGRYGAFIGCSEYPTCKYTRPLTAASVGTKGTDTHTGDGKTTSMTHDENTRDLGKDGAGHTLTVKKGPYGWYVQLGDGKESKRISVPKNYDPSTLDAKQALALLSLPRVLGNDTSTNQVVETSIGRYGAYVKRGNVFQSLAPTDDVLTIDLARALALLSGAKQKASGEQLGLLDGQAVMYATGRYGAYLKWGKKNFPLPKDMKAAGTKPSLEEAIAIIHTKG